ncbi:MAG: Asp-tRNA(Asn)/Glu-tRNA(Gln) amidotransferase GatCAB subunit B [Gammaproteobacteria bacterium]|nr:MAG: Asp-tRNA(Asn)/Glu-tRNA(Gln) amidotransferase GatCAB subunit B [Gammaproteobacteria bacterium]
MQWETIIGLEIHIQLATKSKIFSGSSTQYGAAPNTQANAVDLAMPGMLPVPNEQAFRYAIMFGLAIDAEINQRSVFERKNYFYPDLPKGYQTTQLESPIVGSGHVEITLPDGGHKTIRIHHAHLEEDAGKSLHEDYHGMSGIDLNRAGTPLIEVVTEPDMRSSEEAVAFAKKLHAIVTSLGICDGEMSQGSMRFDINISIRPQGEDRLGTRTETKNLNSFRFMEKAIEHEVARQIDILEEGGQITQETRLFDGEKELSRSMRSKEEANDYRYFPCPDLLPVVFDDHYIEAIRNHLPELPDARRARFIEQYKLSDYDAGILSVEADMARFFETTVSTCGDAKLAANWIMGELSAHLNADEKSIADSCVSAAQLGQLITRLKDNTLSSSSAKKVLEALWNNEGDDIDQLIEAKGLKQVSDSGELEKLVETVLEDMADQITQYKQADDKKRKKLMGGFMGPLMKASKGQGNPKILTEILKKKLDS